MTSARQPSAPHWQLSDDDEPTRVMVPAPPPSVGGLVVPVQEAPAQEAPSATAVAAPPHATVRRVALGAFVASLAVGLGALAVVPKLAPEVRTLAATAAPARAAAPQAALQAAVPARAPAAAAAPQATPRAAAPQATPGDAAAARADARLDRPSYNPISGGLIILPSTFASADGAYDLVVHFHGLHELVSESFEHGGLNAVVVVVNLGIGSASYANQFSGKWGLTAILDRTQETLRKRGLREPRLRRLALSAFSAGYGAVRGILSQPAFAEQVDAVLLQDGIHTGYQPKDHSLDLERLMPFSRFAEQAAAGKKLFTITHSEITPNEDYAGTHECTDALLALTGVDRSAGGETPVLPDLRAMENVGQLVPLAPLSEAHKGGFHVRGYAGTQKADHIMHLAQMSETVVPELVRRWGS